MVRQARQLPCLNFQIRYGQRLFLGILRFLDRVTADPFLTRKFWNFGKKKLSKSLLIDSPLIFSHERLTHQSLIAKVQNITFWTVKPDIDPGGPSLGPIDMPTGGSFEIGTQIILIKIDRFLRGWILSITSFKNQHATIRKKEYPYVISKTIMYKLHYVFLLLSTPNYTKGIAFIVHCH